MTPWPGGLVFAVLCLLLSIPVSMAQAQSPQETLSAYVSALQKAP